MKEECSKQKEQKVQKPSNGNELAMSKEKKDGRCLEGSVNNKENGGRGQRWRQESHPLGPYRL